MSDDNLFNQQRTEGADQIVGTAQRMATAHSIAIESAEWDRGHLTEAKTKHQLSIIANGRTTIGEFADEWLRDYPGRVGTEKANAVISEMIRKLVTHT